MASLVSFRGHRREELVDGSVCEQLFRYQKTQRACRIFLDWLKKNHQAVTPSELSQFTRDLEQGRVERGFTYRRVSFYRGVFKRLVSMGFVEKRRNWRGIVYAPIIQPIPLRPPPMMTFYGLSYLIAEKWNQEWAKR